MIFLSTRLYFLFTKVKTMLDKILKRNNCFEMKIGIECKTMNNIDYSSNYDGIFKNNGLKLDRQTLPINKLDTQLDSKSLSEIDYRNKIDKLF